MSWKTLRWIEQGIYANFLSFPHICKIMANGWYPQQSVMAILINTSVSVLSEHWIVKLMSPILFLFPLISPGPDVLLSSSDQENKQREVHWFSFCGSRQTASINLCRLLWKWKHKSQNIRNKILLLVHTLGSDGHESRHYSHHISCKIEFNHKESLFDSIFMEKCQC